VVERGVVHRTAEESVLHAQHSVIYVASKK
jgi:hypothetical protein